MEIDMNGGDVFEMLWLLGGIALPFFPIPVLIYLALLISSLFVPARWFGFDA
jgi:hypothetical protein